MIIEQSHRFGASRTVIPFDDIEETSLGELGDDEGGSISYHVLLRWRSGREVALFVGFFEYVYSRPQMEARRERLEQYLRSRTNR